MAEGAPAWFPEMGQDTPRVLPAPSAGRARGRMQRIDITWPGGQRSVMAKVTSLHAPAESLEARPRLGTSQDYRDRHELEFATLSKVHDHFSALSDPRLGSIRPLAHVPEHTALIMEYVTGRTLREWSRPSAAWNRRSRRDTAELYHRAGAWLRGYHAAAAAPPEHRRGSPGEFRAALEAYLEFLRPHVRGSVRLQPLADAAAAAFSTSHAPELVLGHADCAPRNFLVTEQRRVVGFDVLGKWAVPREEDIAYFLLSLRLIAPRAGSMGLAYPLGAIDQWAGAFLAGYGVEQISRDRLYAYEVLMVLDRWAAAVTRRPTGLRARAEPAFKAVMGAALRKEARRLSRVLT